MDRFRFRRTWGMVAALALVAGVLPLLLAGTASAATSATVHNDAEFFAAWIDPGITQIDLANSISLTQLGNCGYYPVRNTSGGAVLLDGHGFTLTQTCDANSVVYDSGSGEALTIQNITIQHEGAPTPSVSGNGVWNDGPVTVVNSTITGNWTASGQCADNVSAVCLNQSRGGGIASNGDVTVENSTISNNRADRIGGGISASGAVTVTNSTVTGNQVSSVNGYAFGGGIYAGSGATVTNSTVSSNTATCASSCEFDNVGGGGIASEGGVTTVTNSSVTGNHAVCDTTCDNVGGGILSGATLALSGSTVSSNDASCTDDCQADGGGIYASTGYFYDSASGQAVHSAGGSAIVTITDSTLSGNQATVASTNCDCSGGAVFTDMIESFTVTRSTVSNNTATWDGGASESYTNDGAVPTGVRYENSTVTGNSSGFAGAIDARQTGATLTLAYDTIDANTYVAVSSTATSSSAKFTSHGEGLHSALADPQPANLSTNELTSFGTVVADPIGAANCSVSGTTSQGYSFSDDASCGFTNTTLGDKQNAGSPLLNSLADNGGPTSTMLPFTPKTNSAASPLIDAIPVAACQTGVAAGVGIDQRSVTRPQLLGCDIGAVEVTGAEYQVEAAAVIAPKFTG